MCKNLIYGLLTAGMLLTSCIYEGLETDNLSEEAQVTFSLDLENVVASKAQISDGTKANKLVYSVYKVDAETGALEIQPVKGSENYQVVVNDFASGAEVTVPLAKGQTYRAAFWAQSADCLAYETSDLTEVQVSYASALNNAENRDAFWATIEFVAESDAVYDVVMRRPFAQVNVGVYEKDWNDAVAAGFEVGESVAVIRNAATSINLLTGEVGDETTDVEVVYAAGTIPSETLYVNTDESTEEPEAYKWLSMSYILVADHSGVADANGIKGGSSATLESAEFTFNPKNGGASIELKDGLTNIPVQRNWRTNIIGNVLTGDVNFNITLDPAYYNDYLVTVVAEGVTYDAAAGVYYISGPEGLSWVSANVANEDGFAGKTLKLTSDIDLYKEDTNGEPVCFKPIGSYRDEIVFSGVFDGQGYTIKNLNQNTWALDFGYYYSDLGLGLFSCVEDATIKNLKVDNASISGESALCGVVAATAFGDMIFENITVTNSKCNDYQYYAGGIVGWASGNHQYINCNVDESTVVGGQWGDFGNSNGGVIGGVSSSAEIYMKDCNVACRIDAVNDVVSSYQYYAYRCCGMLIGNTNNTQVIDGTPYAAAPNLTCENVTVTYGEWMNYHYCEFAGTGYPYVRVEPGVSVDAYVNIRYGHPADANGNTVVDHNHVHNDGEDHFMCLAFDQLLGGGPNGNGRNPVYGLSSFEGVTVNYPSEYTCSVCGQQHNVEASNDSE